jgi:hypothetical protein
MDNKETEYIFNNDDFCIFIAPCTDGSTLYGYRLPDIFGLICMTTHKKALKRAQFVIDHPESRKGMWGSDILLPKYNWFK